MPRNGMAPSHGSELEVTCASDKDIGGREHDEDAVLVRPDLELFAVADGAGGQNAGNVASSLAVAAVARHFEATMRSIDSLPVFDVLGLPHRARRLSSAVQRANREVLEVARSSDRFRGMGTTLVALHPDLSRSVVHIAHVGDSRCYRLRNGRVELLTRDHSLAEDVLSLSPDIDDETASRLPENVITRAIGMSDTVRVSVRTFDLAPADVYMLATDGLTDVVSDAEIAELLTVPRSASDKAKALIGIAQDRADDNLAVVVVGVDLIPGRSSFPKRHGARAEPRPRSEHPREANDDDPEIVIVDDHSEGQEPVVHVVPRDAGAPQQIGALARVVFPRPAALPSRVGPTLPAKEDEEA